MAHRHSGGRMISALKTRRRKVKSKRKVSKVVRNATLFFANKRRKEIIKEQKLKLSYKDSCALFVKCLEEYKHLSPDEKRKNEEEWTQKKLECIVQSQSSTELERYNSVEPAYKKLLYWYSEASNKKS